LQIIKDAVAKPQPASPWKSNATNLDTRLVRAAGGANKDDVDLLVLLRNTGKSPRTFEYRDWPLATKSQCSLEVVNLATKQKAAAKDVPIPKQDIADYFSKYGSHFTVKIAPGESHVMPLWRVTTAKKGWGYKEELGFRFYPVTTPGRHSVAAQC